MATLTMQGSEDHISTHKKPIWSRPSVGTRVIQSQKSVATTSAFFIILAIVISGTSSLIVILTRSMHITVSSDGATRLTNNDQHVVQTGSSQANLELSDLPAMASPSTYNRIGSVGYYKLLSNAEAVPPVQVSSKLETWTWISDTRMTLQLADGTTVLIDNGGIEFAVKPTIQVSFNDTGAAVMTPPEPYTAEVGAFDRVKSQCNMVGCPLAQCTAMLSTNRGFGFSSPATVVFNRGVAFPFKVMCGALPVWEYPQDVEISSAPAGGVRQLHLEPPRGRQLQFDCYADCHKNACSKMRWMSSPESCAQKAYACMVANCKLETKGGSGGAIGIGGVGGMGHVMGDGFGGTGPTIAVTTM